MGSYTCVAANVAGSDECRAVLAVQGQCQILREQEEKGMTEDETAGWHH